MPPSPPLSLSLLRRGPIGSQPVSELGSRSPRSSRRRTLILTARCAQVMAIVSKITVLLGLPPKPSPPPVCRFRGRIRQYRLFDVSDSLIHHGVTLTLHMTCGIEHAPSCFEAYSGYTMKPGTLPFGCSLG